jgi:ubiquinone/menaquinone biosynthesis C-methylase UbiE
MIFKQDIFGGCKMKENKYDDETFFEKYKNMPRSVYGLDAAGEWQILKTMLPSFSGKKVLDLGCGFGWHCCYAAEHGAETVTGVDISEKMLEIAREKTTYKNITYINNSIENISFHSNYFDIILSSLAFHYVAPFDEVVGKIYTWLNNNGIFVFSVEHPVFTSEGKQDWHYDEQGSILHWPVDNYFFEGPREAIFLGEKITKYHRTLTSYLKTLLKYGFNIIDINEPKVTPEALEKHPDWKDELRRPMMLLISVKK